MKRPPELGNSRRASQNRKATRAGRRAVRARRHRRGSTQFRVLTRQHRRICTVASGTPPAGVKLRLARLPRHSRRPQPPRRPRPGGCEPPSGARLEGSAWLDRISCPYLCVSRLRARSGAAPRPSVRVIPAAGGAAARHGPSLHNNFAVGVIITSRSEIS